MTTILIIRHGETEWNREKIFRGVHDIPLNENGREQATQLGRALASCTIHAAYTSPLSRAVETASLALAEQDIDAVIEDRLLDFSYGDWTGMTEPQVAERWPDELEAWQKRPDSLRVPGGDTLKEVYDRGFAGMEEIAARHSGETVALFGHRALNKLLVLAALGLGPERFPFIRLDNTSLCEFHHDTTGYTLVRTNDTSHVTGADVLTVDF